MPATLSPEALAALPADVTLVNGRFMRTSYHYKLYAADGTNLHNSQSTPERCHEIIDTGTLFRDCGPHKQGTPYVEVGAHVRVERNVREANRSEALLWASEIDPEMWCHIKGDAARMTNMIGGQPSGNMASAISSYKRDPARFMAQREADRANDRRVQELERAHIRSGLIDLDHV